MAPPKDCRVLIILLAMILLQIQEPIQPAPDGRHFERSWSRTRFVPIGANYAPRNLILEDHWDSHWDEIVRDFAEMRQMGMNVARVHLQFDRFMRDAKTPNAHALKMLRRLVRAAERENLYLDITGLACYRPMYVPLWYDRLPEEERWECQARFWKAVAMACRNSNAIFCYDLINEPISPAGRRAPEQWYSGALFGGFDFIQFIALDPKGRPREQIAADWVRRMADAIRSVDSRHMITVGLLPSDARGNHFSGFKPQAISASLEFMSVHIYPKTGKTTEALVQLRAVDTGKPVLIEETFPLHCSISELERFLADGSTSAAGVIAHYWGTTPAEITVKQTAGTATISEGITLHCLNLMMRMRAQLAGRESYRIAPEKPRR